ncbi:MAG: CRISPR-associated protein Cas10/Csm1 [Syntrophomonadaceae bacterium]|nr:CRISPR-associated protein Cas10/Csm1 [Bacillota bacterium]MBT9146869.1 CRISPR-associated protein Cas10/Csm1 [Bacillota bacterium]
MNMLEVALAGAIHDWGKFAQRTHLWKGTHAEIGATLVDEFKDLFPYDWLDDLRDAVGDHHGGRSEKEIVKVVRIADRLASKERRSRDFPKMDPACTPLIPVFATVEIRSKPSSDLWGYHLNPLSLNEDVLFPQTPLPEVNPGSYEALWMPFEEEVCLLASSGAINSPVRFASFLALLKKYLSFVPSATPWEEDEEHRTYPDISLFDHLKVAAAIASCLNRLSPDHLEELHRGRAREKAVAFLLRGDFSGVQNFIYRVARPREDATFHGVGRRLRGRSFYLALLNTIVAQWLGDELEFTSANILFEGGGRFDLLIPVDNKSQVRLEQSINQLDEWFLNEFEGELGLVTAMEEVSPEDFETLGEVYKRLEAQLADRKLQKWRNLISDRDFLCPKEERHHSCQVCGLVALPKPDICELCNEHHELGRCLSSADYLALVYDGSARAEDENSTLFSQPLNVQVKLLSENEKVSWLKGLKAPPNKTSLYRLNSTDFVFRGAPEGLGLGFCFLAKEVPVARGQLRLLGREEVTREGDGLDFVEIAELSPGSKDLGVLKADVDHLGFILSEGVVPTISRLSTLSHSIDCFFSGWLNILCQNRFEKWQTEEGRHPWANKFDGLVYIAYSGGDDMLILAPWEQTLELAKVLNHDFTKYTCENPNITISCGINLVKPSLPVQRFVRLATSTLDRVKEEGRNRISLFGKTFEWTDGLVNYEEFLRFAQELQRLVEQEKVPRGLLHDLEHLHRLYYQNSNGERKPLLTPALYYTMARRLKMELCQEILPRVLIHIKNDSLHSLLSYVILATRKEGERCR